MVLKETPKFKKTFERISFGRDVFSLLSQMKRAFSFDSGGSHREISRDFNGQETLAGPAWEICGKEGVNPGVGSRAVVAASGWVGVNVLCVFCGQSQSSQKEPQRRDPTAIEAATGCQLPASAGGQAPSGEEKLTGVTTASQRPQRLEGLKDCTRTTQERGAAPSHGGPPPGCHA